MRRGFTLVEIVLAMTLFSAMGMSLVVLLSANLRSAQVSALNSQIKAEGQYLTRLFGQRARYALSCSSSDNQTISFILSDSQSPLKFSCLGSKFWLNQDGVTDFQLTANSLVVTNCNFTCTGNDVAMAFDLSSTGTALSQNFSSQISLRNAQN